MADVFEMLWDCAFCGQKKLLGKTHRHCPSCGAAQDPSARYFPADADKVRVQDHVLVGADKLCPACQAPKSARATHCGACGAPLEGAKEVAQRRDQTGAALPGEPAAAARRELAAAKASGTAESGG